MLRIPNRLICNLQYQEGEKIPYARDARYQYTVGFSAIIEQTDNFKTGFALNYAAVDDKDRFLLRSLGIDGDDLAVLFGFQWFGEKWYVATVFSWLDNHMATSDGVYFDAWGTEGYGQYQIFERVWQVGMCSGMECWNCGIRLRSLNG